MSNDIPPGYGYAEYLGERDGHLEFRGWLTLLDGAFDGYEAVDVQSGKRVPAKIDVRPALAEAHPHIPDSESTGFHALIPMPNPLPATWEIEVHGMRGGKPVAKMQLGYHRAPEQPFPTSEMMRRATGNDGHHFFRTTGIKACNDFRRALAPHVALDKVGTFLEWGCGSGRLTTHLIDRHPQAKMFGTDIDLESVAWAGENLKGNFQSCKTDPPLPYEDNQFELIVSLSVFTHLTLSYQEAWLPELKRILKPDGVLLATVHGEFASRWIFHRPGEYDKVMANGFFDGLDDAALQKYDFAGPDYYKSTFQTKTHTEREWGKHFDIVGYVEGGMNNFQDIVVMRNKA